MEDPDKTSTKIINAANQLIVGEIFDGKFEVFQFIDSGGMGSVYRVKHLLLNRELALKVLHGNGNVSETTIRRFQQEANAAFALNHPHLIRVFDMGVTSESVPYFSMEFVCGSTLSKFLKTNGPQSWSACRAFVEQTCDAIKHAHERGVVHRDLKPGNIILVDDNLADSKILDFGIAKLFTSEQYHRNDITETGEVVGSPLYMSPEQCAGDEIDQRSDIYSLGCVFFELLTGTPPHMGANPLRTMMLHQSVDAPTLREAALGREFSPELESIISRMLARHKSDRFSTMDEVIAAFANLDHPKNIDKKTSEKSNGKLSSGLIVTVCSVVGLLIAVSIIISLMNSRTQSIPVKESRNSASLSPDVVEKKFPEELPNLKTTEKDVSIRSETAVDDLYFAKVHSKAQREYQAGNQLGADKKYIAAHLKYIGCMKNILDDRSVGQTDVRDTSWISRAYGLIALCLAQNKKYDDAQGHLKEAIRLDPRIAENNILRGNLYAITGQSKMAKESYKIAQEKSQTHTFPTWATKLKLCQLPVKD